MRSTLESTLPWWAAGPVLGLALELAGVRNVRRTAGGDDVYGQAVRAQASHRLVEETLRGLPAILRRIEHQAAELEARPVPVERLEPAQFRLPACRALMQQVREALDAGARFAVIDRLPIEDFGKDVSRSLYWLLSSLIARPVEQKLTGTLLYEVRDTGKKAFAGSGVRPDQTNMEQYFHNDNSYNTTPPDYVGLLCERPARSGGISHVISFYTVHNELLRTRPEVLPRLYRPFWFDRQKEYLPEEPRVIFEPMFSYERAPDGGPGGRYGGHHAGTLRARMGLFKIQSGYTLMSEVMDEEAVAAFAALKEVLAKPELSRDFVLQRGQLQFANNRELCHRRTLFEDFEEPELKRVLLRVWLREAGQRRYQG